MKNVSHNDPNKILEAIKNFENMVEQPQFDLNRRQDVKVNLRVDESVSPAKFKPDPLIPGGYIANSLTIRAMRTDIFVLGDSLEDLSALTKCKCGQEIDIQFWKLCPFCSRSAEAF